MKTPKQRQAMIDKAAEMATGTYCRKFVAPVFQRMIRAEAGAMPDGFAWAVVDGGLFEIPRYLGECVCVTCGTVNAWDSGIKGMHTGHFIASRRNSILLVEENVAPQCSSCNFYRSGSPSEFRLWMETIRGVEVIERLQELKRKSVTFSREELVDLKIEFSERLKAAQDKMKGVTCKTN